MGLFYVNSVDLERLDSFTNLLSFTVTTLKFESKPAVQALMPLLFARVSQVQYPRDATSEVDKSVLRGIAAFVRLVSIAIETLEFKEVSVTGLTAWLLAVFQTNAGMHPDKPCKKAIAYIFKEILVQLSYLKYQTAKKDTIVQLLGVSKKVINESAGTLKDNMQLDLQTLPADEKAVVEQALTLALSVFHLNTGNLDDLQILKPLAEIQIAFVMLGFRLQIAQGLATNGQAKGIQNGEMLVQVIDEFLANPATQIKRFHDVYLQGLR